MKYPLHSELQKGKKHTVGYFPVSQTKSFKFKSIQSGYNKMKSVTDFLSL